MYKQRINHIFIENSFKRQYVTAILGPRRVGKTYFVENYASHHPDRKWVFLNMDKMEQRQRICGSQLPALISELAKQPLGSADKLWVVIDEAQKCPEVFDQIKCIYDAYKEKNKIKFILTGSAILSLHQLSAESLAGRIELLQLQEFTLREAALAQESALPMDSILDILTGFENTSLLVDYFHNLAPFKPVLEQELMQQLIWGGFPELITTHSAQEKLIYLNNYLQTYLEKDVRAIETITDLNLYRNLMDIVAYVSRFACWFAYFLYPLPFGPLNNFFKSMDNTI